VLGHTGGHRGVSQLEEEGTGTSQEEGGVAEEAGRHRLWPQHGLRVDAGRRGP